MILLLATHQHSIFLAVNNEKEAQNSSSLNSTDFNNNSNSSFSSEQNDQPGLGTQRRFDSSSEAQINKSQQTTTARPQKRVTFNSKSEIIVFETPLTDKDEDTSFKPRASTSIDTKTEDGSGPINRELSEISEINN